MTPLERTQRNVAAIECVGLSALEAAGALRSFGVTVMSVIECAALDECEDLSLIDAALNAKSADQ